MLFRATGGLAKIVSSRYINGMILNAMMLLGCWAGTPHMEHKFLDDGNCDDYAIEFYMEGDKLHLRKLAVSCPNNFDTTWTELNFDLRDDGVLWAKPTRGDEKIVGWFKDAQFHAEDSLNAWMYSVWHADYMRDDSGSETIDWQDRLIRADEQFWAVQGLLQKVECQSLETMRP